MGSAFCARTWKAVAVIVYERQLPDGRIITVLAMIFNYRIAIGEGWEYSDGWCYPRDLGKAFVLAAAQAWDGEGDPPDGWIKHLGSGRRRTDGDPAREYVER